MKGDEKKYFEQNRKKKKRRRKTYNLGGGRGKVYLIKVNLVSLITGYERALSKQFVYKRDITIRAHLFSFWSFTMFVSFSFFRYKIHTEIWLILFVG